MRASVCVDRVGIGDQEERRGEAIPVEDGDSLLELASQSVVEGKGNKCWFVHCLATIVFHMPSRRGVFVGAVSQDRGAGKGTCRKHRTRPTTKRDNSESG